MGRPMNGVVYGVSMSYTTPADRHLLKELIRKQGRTPMEYARARRHRRSDAAGKRRRK